MHVFRSAALTVLYAASLVAGCSRPERTYELRGQVIAIDEGRAQMTIKHEDIRGFMPGMTMPFTVEDPRALRERQPGELITATLVVAENHAYLRDVRRTGAAPLTEEAPAAAPPDVLQPGAAAPDAPFTDERGSARRLADWHGQAVAVTFIYTRCPLPDFCPLMDRHFRQVQEAVAADATLRGRVHLLSVSFDPDTDTPPVLRAHARRAGADAAHWTFLTASRADLDRFASRFGVSIIRPETADAEIVHNLRTAVIDTQGRLVTIYSGNDWTPPELLAQLRNGLR